MPVSKIGSISPRIVWVRKHRFENAIKTDDQAEIR